MKKEDFNIRFKDMITSGKAKVSYRGMKVRIICWDRVGEYPIIGLMETEEWKNPETFIEIGCDGTVHLPSTFITSKIKLQVEYDPIGISKKARVCYSLLKAPCIERYMQKYGYVEDEEKGWHWNAVNFANIYAKSHTNELHADLKADGRWNYDDDYDWE